MSFDGAAFGKEIVTVVQKFVGEANAPLFARIDALEKQLAAVTSVDHTPTIERAVDGVLILRLSEVADQVESSVRNTLPDFPALVSEAVAALPAAPTLDEVKSAAVTELKPVLAEMAVEIKDSIPVPKDGEPGKDALIDLDYVQGLVADKVIEAVKALPVPVDGTSIKGASLNDEGQLILSLSDGSQLNAGTVVGRDGKDAETDALFQLMEETFAAIPVPKDGKDGKDGIDGKDGRGIVAAGIDGEGFLFLDFSEDVKDRVMLGHVVGKDGHDAMDISDVTLSVDGMLEIHLGNSIIKSIGPVVGKDGRDGLDIKDVQLSPEGNLEVYFSNGTFKSIGPIVGKDGVSVDQAKLEEVLLFEIDKAVKALPPPQEVDLTPMHEFMLTIEESMKGFDQTFIQLSEQVKAAASNIKDGVGLLNIGIDEQGALFVELTDGTKKSLGHVIGRDGDTPDITPAIERLNEQFRELAEGYTKAISEIENGKDGVGIKDVRLEDGNLSIELTDGVVKAVGPIVQPPVDLEAVAKLVPVPKDGVDGVDGINLAGALIDRDGELIVTLSNGTAHKLGPVVGKDVDLNKVAELVVEAVRELPTPKNGMDGVGFDDMDITMGEDGRTMTITAAKGENRKSWSFRLDHVLDKGVFREGTEYLKGDGTTFGGSFWIAQKDTESRPGEGNADWRLAVKKGRDGKDGKLPEKPKPVELNGKA